MFSDKQKFLARRVVAPGAGIAPARAYSLPKLYQAVTSNDVLGETPCLVQISIESV